MFANHTGLTTVVIFCTLTVLLSFATYLLPLPRDVLPFLIVLIPALMAVILTAIHGGKVDVYALLGQLGQWRLNAKWLAIALLLAFVMRLGISVVALMLGLISTIQVRPWQPAQFAILAVILVISALPEELGWRGYVLPKLLTTYSARTSSLMIGVVWGVLHLALQLPGMMNEGVPALATVIAIASGSVLFTWLYVNSDGNLLLATLFHAAQSFFVIINEGIAPAEQMWLMAGVYTVLALLVALLTGPHLSTKVAQSPVQALLMRRIECGIRFITLH
jgi:membrane protease YdiL (CAAX protease family)